MFRKLVVYTSLHDITLIHQLINDVYLNSIVRVYCYSYAVERLHKNVVKDVTN